MIERNKISIIRESVGWDAVNWAKGLAFWEKRICLKDKDVLELGCGCKNGGLSLWASKLGSKTVCCSDYKSVTALTKRCHQVYNCNNIRYELINALDIPYSEKFDVIMFKSMIGGICRENIGNVDIVLKNCAKALKTGGKMIFAENLASTKFHMWCRKKLKGMTWHYFEKDELLGYINKANLFKVIDHAECGIVACFGRTEKQRRLLGHLDRFFERIFPRNCRYIQFWVLEKK